MFWKQHNYALAGNDPPYELKDTKDVNKIDIANDIYDHNDDVQHTAKAGGGANMDKCPQDNCNLLYMFPGPFV